MTAGTSEEAALAVSARVSEGRLWDHLMEMARYGATPAGGVNRQALSEADGEARRHMVKRARERGYTVATDPVGNLFIRRAGRDEDAAPVIGGSHLDSQPTGGKFDGAYGVLAAFEALIAMDEAGVVTRRPVEVASWVNEEGCRFQPVTMGSAIFAGDLRLDEAMAAVDGDGTAMGDALAAYLATTPGLEQRPFGFPIAAYVEPHIEQGPVLERAGQSVAVVEGVQGLRWFEVEVEGEAAHAGTTPRAARRDAMRAATGMLARLYGATDDRDDRLRFTVGRMAAEPGSPNTVPARVRFTIDLRHPESQVIDLVSTEIAAAAREVGGGCTASVTRTADTPPTVFDRSVVATLDAWRGRLGLTGRRMTSGAGHDAMYIARLAPAAMIFVPCENGISHHEAENASPADLVAGARLLAASLVDLAGAP